jgi:ABC-2 type transporter
LLFLLISIQINKQKQTKGEMLASRAPVLCGDEISTGLDAASTYDMVQVILHSARTRQQTNIFSLLQPSPETVSLFDEVIVLAEGQIIFAGPINEVEDYFADIGYKSPQFTDVADFLQMVSTDDGADLYDPAPAVAMNRANLDPPTVNELAVLFQTSEFGTEIFDKLQRPSRYIWKEGDTNCPEGVVSDLSESELVRCRYANRFHRSILLITKRFLTLWIRDKRVIIAGFVKNILMGVSVGGVFYNTEDPISIQGCLFQAGLFIMLGKSTGSTTFVYNLSSCWLTSSQSKRCHAGFCRID